MSSSPETWTWKDALAGSFFVAIGALAITYSVLVVRNDHPISLWLPGFLLGPVMIFLGLNAVVRGLKGGRAGE